jgi:hypothetical protein
MGDAIIFLIKKQKKKILCLMNTIGTLYVISVVVFTTFLELPKMLYADNRYKYFANPQFMDFENGSFEAINPINSTSQWVRVHIAIAYINICFFSFLYLRSEIRNYEENILSISLACGFSLITMVLPNAENLYSISPAYAIYINFGILVAIAYFSRVDSFYEKWNILVIIFILTFHTNFTFIKFLCICYQTQRYTYLFSMCLCIYFWFRKLEMEHVHYSQRCRPRIESNTERLRRESKQPLMNI